MLGGNGFDDEILAVVRSHHEMLDGSGYPDGLVGHKIPDLVRLVTVCDVYGALIERRPYRAPVPAENAYETLRGMTGRLDAHLVSAFKPVTDAFLLSNISVLTAETR
jgi:HD-GYP domain-containing protein (c-di-GMP phosphodiesterase class II)